MGMSKGEIFAALGCVALVILGLLTLGLSSCETPAPAEPPAAGPFTPGPVLGEYLAENVRWARQLCGRLEDLNDEEIRILAAENVRRWEVAAAGGPRL